jgi:hypothetical protein
MIDWMDVMAKQQYRKEREQEAEHSRLVREALAARKPHPRLFHRLLSALGKQLVEWGWHLQQHAQTPQYSR